MDERKEALKRRTKAFASGVVRFYIALDKNREKIRVLGKQLLRSALRLQPTIGKRRGRAQMPNSYPKSSNAFRRQTNANCGLNCCGMIAAFKTKGWNGS